MHFGCLEIDILQPNLRLAQCTYSNTISFSVLQVMTRLSFLYTENSYPLPTNKMVALQIYCAHTLIHMQGAFYVSSN